VLLPPSLPSLPSCPSLPSLPSLLSLAGDCSPELDGLGAEGLGKPEDAGGELEDEEDELGDAGGEPEGLGGEELGGEELGGVELGLEGLDGLVGLVMLTQALKIRQIQARMP